MRYGMSIERACQIADQRNAEMLEAHKKELVSTTDALLPVIEDYINDGVSDDFAKAIAEIVRGNGDKPMYVGRGTPLDFIAEAIKQHVEKIAHFTAPTTDEEAVLCEDELQHRMEAA